MDDPVEHLDLDAREHLRCVLVERVQDRHHDVPIPSGSGITLIRLRGAARGDVFHRAELHDAILRIEDRRQLGSDRNMNRIRAGDDDAGLVQHRDDGPIVGTDEVGEYQFQLVLEPEAEAEDAEHRAVGVGDAESIDQRPLAVRDKVRLTKRLDVAGLRLDGGADERVVARHRRYALVEAGENIALRIEQDDVGVNRIFTDVFPESLAQGCNRGGAVGLIANVAQKGADVLVTREEADIGGPLEQVPDQDVDRDLRLGAGFLETLLQRLPPELVEQASSELAEGPARAAHVGSGAGQLAEQAQVVPDRLQMLQDPAVFFRRGHVRNDAFQVRFEINAFELNGHRPTRQRRKYEVNLLLKR